MDENGNDQNHCPMYFIYPMKAVMTKEYDATLVRLLMHLHRKNVKIKHGIIITINLFIYL